MSESAATGSAQSFVQLRIPKSEAEAFSDLEFWTRNVLSQTDKVLADGWTERDALAYALTDLRAVLGRIDKWREALDAAS